MIYEEFRMIKKDIVDTVLSPFLIVRQCEYIKKEEYSHLLEEPTEIYISSAHMKQNWMWNTMRLATKEMYKSMDNAIIIGFDYCITLKHGIRTRKQLIKEKKKLGATAFTMEYENVMIGSSENAYFDYESLNQCQKLSKPFYPREDIDVFDKKKHKYSIPKQEGEIRIISVDIAMVAGKDNDNTVASCIRAINQGAEYERQVPYIESFNGMATFDQAIRIKQLFYDFDADYVVLDGRNSGVSVFDELGRVNYDEKRDVEYPSWTCFNDQKTADRVKIPNAKPVVFVINATATLNHEIATKFKDNLNSKKIKLLIPVEAGKDYLIDKNYYTVDSSPEKMAQMENPYLQTELLINEAVNLTWEYNENSNTIKVKENRNARKDRYTSCSYGSYFIDLLERDLFKDETDDMSSFVFW